MSGPGVDAETRTDGTVVVRPRGGFDPASTVHLRQLLVHTIRHVRPHRLVLDLRDVRDLDPIDLGTLAAACLLGEDHHVAVFLDSAPTHVAVQLAAAGVPRQRLRHTALLLA